MCLAACRGVGGGFGSDGHVGYGADGEIIIFKGDAIIAYLKYSYLWHVFPQARSSTIIKLNYQNPYKTMKSKSTFFGAIPLAAVMLLCFNLASIDLFGQYSGLQYETDGF